ncbi:MAG: lysostaphin resistance A-like protein [Planctomycetota bacterium]|jgi:membrane protease YdiL (CAAX protease family)
MQSDPAEIPEIADAPPEKPIRWGLWPTLGFSFLVVIGALFVQIILIIVYLAAEFLGNSDVNIDAIVEQIEADKDYLWICTMATYLVSIMLIFMFVKLRKGITIKNYLSLHRVKLKSIAFWTALVLLYCVATDTLFFLLKIDPGYDWASEEFVGTRYKILLILSINLLAPFTEELFFRGFLFEGFGSSRRGMIAAITIPAFFWSIIHVQYNLDYILVIFGSGILLGIARVRTKSLYTPMAMHFFWNVYATLYVVYWVS